MEVINSPIINETLKPLKKKKKKNVCPYVSNEEKCKDKISMIVGKCNYCEKVFCLLHRLPESHNCIYIENLKNDKMKENTDKLLNNKCSLGKINKI